ncbi:MAG: ANTAR domain-containing protein, partial [Ilumatobacteraceae bacterium]
SRISIEQAKGMISERGHVDMDEAFNRLRSFARNNNRGLTEVAESLVAGTTSIESVWERRRPPAPPAPAAPPSVSPTPPTVIKRP